MLNLKLHLNTHLFGDGVKEQPTRQGFGEGLVIAGEKDEQVVALCADLSDSTRVSLFKKRFPDRFIQVGVAEQALATIAAGMANYGKTPFIASYATFSPGRNWEQIRTTAALNNVPVKIAGCHAGISVGPDGATHQALEDIATMRVIPNMIVVYPADAIEASKATIAAAENGKPTYIRLAREKTPLITTVRTPFKIGKAEVFWTTPRPLVSLVATGPLLYETLIAAEQLKQSGIDSHVINCHTIKPLDEPIIVKSAMSTGAVVTIEEHQMAGGLGGAVAEVLVQKYPVPMEFIGMQDQFSESGQPEELLEKFKMKAVDIVKAAKKVIARK